MILKQICVFYGSYQQGIAHEWAKTDTHNVTLGSSLKRGWGTLEKPYRNQATEEDIRV